jgi:hypothetical protein
VLAAYGSRFSLTTHPNHYCAYATTSRIRHGVADDPYDHPNHPTKVLYKTNESLYGRTLRQTPT